MDARIVKSGQNLAPIVTGRPTRNLFFILTSLLVAFNAASEVTLADETEVILVTAHRSAAADLETAYSFSLIDEEQVIARNYRSTIEVFRDVPGVLVQKTAHGQGSPFIRGFTGYHNLFLIDGIRLNNSIFRAGPNQYWNTVDPLSVGRYEIIKGPSSTLYGSDAIGGTVNSLTKSVQLSETQGRIYTRGATAERSALLRGELNLSTSAEQGLLIGGSLKDFGDIETGQGKLQHSGYQEQTLDLKYIRHLSETLSVTAAHYYVSQDNVPRTHKTIYGQSFAGTTVGNELKRELDQKRQLSYIKLDHAGADSFYDSFSATASYHQQEESRDRLRSGNRADQQGVQVDTLGLSLQFSNHPDDHALLYGVDFYHDDVSSYSSSNEIQGPVADDATYVSLGLFTEWRYQWNEHWTSVLGGRYSRYEADANSVLDPVTATKASIEGDWDKIVGNARLIRHLTEGSMVFAGVGQGFRAPNLSDLSRFDSARSNEFEIPSPDLESEEYLSYELGYRYRDENLTLDTTLYYTDIKGMILRFPTGNLNDDGEVEISKANVSDGYVWGAEAAIRYSLTDHWALSLMANYMEGKTDQYPTASQEVEEEYISRLMPTTVNMSCKYTPNDSWFAELQVQVAERADRLSSRDRGDSQRIPPTGTPGYGVMHAYAGYQLTSALHLGLSLENILDKNYRIHGSGQNEVGRNFVASLEWRL